MSQPDNVQASEKSKGKCRSHGSANVGAARDANRAQEHAERAQPGGSQHGSDLLTHPDYQPNDLQSEIDKLFGVTGTRPNADTAGHAASGDIEMGAGDVLTYPMSPSYYPPPPSFFRKDKSDLQDQSNAELMKVEKDIRDSKMRLKQQVLLVIALRMRSRTNALESRLNDLDTILCCATYPVREQPTKVLANIQQIMEAPNTREYIAYMLADEVLRFIVPSRVSDAWKLSQGIRPPKSYCDDHLKLITTKDFIHRFVLLEPHVWAGFGDIIDTPSTMRSAFFSSIADE